MLIDKCPSCDSPIIYHRCSLDLESISLCSGCGLDLRKCEVHAYDHLDDILNFQKHLLGTLNNGWVNVASIGPVYSHLYFDVLHHFMRLFATGKLSMRLRGNIKSYIDENRYDGLQFQQGKYFEFLNVEARYFLGLISDWLLMEWPDRFIWFCRKHSLFSSNLLRDMTQPPYWYWRVVMEALYHPDRIVTEGEIQEAARFMEKRGIPISEASLSKMLGVRQVFRKRMIKLDDSIATVNHCG